MKKGMKLTNHWCYVEVKFMDGKFFEEKKDLGDCLESTAINKLKKIAEKSGYVFRNKGKGIWVHPTTFDTMELHYGKV